MSFWTAGGVTSLKPGTRVSSHILVPRPALTSYESPGFQILDFLPKQAAEYAASWHVTWQSTLDTRWNMYTSVALLSRSRRQARLPWDSLTFSAEDSLRTFSG